MSGSYSHDLAYIHHVGFEKESVPHLAPALLRLLHRAGIRDGLVVDLGCGGGCWLAELGRAGFDTLGVDQSSAMLELARREAPDAELVWASLHDVAIPRCAAVTCLGEGINYLATDRERSRPSLRRFFGRVARALPAGGLFLFDVIVSGRPMAYRSWRAGEDWAVLVEVAEDRDRDLLSREITTFRRWGKGYRRGQERHLQRVFARREIEDALCAAGFAVRVSRSWGRHRLPLRRLSFRAVREA